MSSALDRRTGPTVPRLLLGARLRRLREGAGITRDRAGEIIWGSASKISRMELGQVGSQDRDVADLAGLYGLTDPARRETLFTLAHASRARPPAKDLLPGWALTYIDLEAVASQIRTYEPQFIPGLLQTTDYARALIAESHPGAAAADIERRASLRIERTQLLRHPDSPKLWAVTDEAALQRLIGGPAIMRAQLEHLLEAANLPNITLHVMQAVTGAHAGQCGTFSLLRFPYPELSDIVYIEHLTRGFHLDRPAEVEAYAKVIDTLTVQAATPKVSAEIITRIHDQI